MTTLTTTTTTKGGNEQVHARRWTNGGVWCIHLETPGRPRFTLLASLRSRFSFALPSNCFAYVPREEGHGVTCRGCTTTSSVTSNRTSGKFFSHAFSSRTRNPTDVPLISLARSVAFRSLFVPRSWPPRREAMISTTVRPSSTEDDCASTRDTTDFDGPVFQTTQRQACRRGSCGD